MLPPTLRTTIEHEQFTKMVAYIQRCMHASETRRENPLCIALLGETGTGKTTIAREILQGYPPKREPGGANLPVIFVTTPSSATRRSLSGAIIEAMNDPLGSRLQTTNQRSEYIIKQLKACKVRLVIIDEMHHLIDSDNQRVLNKVADWLKNIIKGSGVPVLAIGVPPKIRRILEHNPELGRLFSIKELTELPAGREVVDFISNLLAKRNISLSDELSKSEWYNRIQYATSGRIGYIINLIDWAVDTAEMLGEETISLEAMSEAYDDRRPSTLLDLENPFVTPADTKFVAPKERGIGGKLRKLRGK